MTSNYGTVYMVTTSPMVLSSPALPMLSVFAITGTSYLQDKVGPLPFLYFPLT